MTLGEIPSIFLTYNLIERQSYGRKNSIIIFFLFNGLFCIAATFYLNEIILFLTKMFIKATSQMIYPFTSESFSTQLRSMGFAFCSITGRIGPTVMPYVLTPFMQNKSVASFYILAVVSFLGMMCIFLSRKIFSTSLLTKKKTKIRIYSQSDRVKYD